MSVVQIRCPNCQAEFVDSRTDRNDDDLARCPRCGTDIAAHLIETTPVATHGRGRVVHAEPIVATPLEDAAIEIRSRSNR